MQTFHHQNWCGHVPYGAARFHQPTSVADVQSIVRAADKARVIGSRHCFNDIADTPGDLIWLGNLDNTVVIDPERHTATVNAGITYRELCPQLHQAGYALPNLASLDHITVIGACMSATHGSGEGLGNLATVVSALEMVTANGDLVALSREQDGDTFDGAVVALGALGVVTKVTLDLQPTFYLQQEVYEELPMDEIFARFDEIMSAGYSVSLFPTWQRDCCDTVWVKRRVNGDTPTPAPQDFYSAALSTGRGPSDDFVDRDWTQHGLPGPWHERLPHFYFKDALAVGNELQSEYFVARRCAVDALRAVAQLGGGLASILGVTEIRTVAADQLWLSPSYGQEIVGIHFNWHKNWAAIEQFLPSLEATLAPFAPRPHWGKLFGIPPADVQAAYPRMADFQELARTFDPEGKFRNRYVERYVFGRPV
jgi:alditol oxidase